MTTVIEQELVKVGDSISISIPSDWSGAQDANVTIILDELGIIVPESIINATGELLVLRLLEAMINTGIIQSDDVQKALEHLV